MPVAGAGLPRARRLLTVLAVIVGVVLGVDVIAVTRGERSPHHEAIAQSVPLAVVSPPDADLTPPTPPTPAVAPVRQLHPGQRVVMDPATSWAVLIGVQHYDAPTHPTYGAIGDVAAFNRLLTSAGWMPSHVLTLTDQQATASGIRGAVRWLGDHSTADGFALFHYSGHVLQTGGRELLWGVDNGLIPNDEFAAGMSAVRGRAWVDIAGCESAGFDKGIATPDRFYTSSSMTTQKSYEEPRWGESVWTGFLVDQALLGGRAGPGPLSIQAAVRWSQTQARTYTSLQEPFGPQDPYAVGGDGEWFLGPRVASAA
ncbi:MAG: hypothetical protein NVSMB4_07980 [Acidimicrobiales bacterium]